MNQPRARGRVGSILLATALLTGAGLLGVGAAPAAAHEQLIGSSPEHGAALDVAPAQASLTFTDKVLTIGAAVLVVDSSGGEWQSSEALISGDTVAVELAGDMPDGAYEVRWRVVSADGHPISGIVPFTVGDAAAVAPPRATAAPTEQKAASDAAGGADDSSSEDAGDGSASNNGADAAQPGGLRVLIVGAIGAGVALLVLGLGILWRRSVRRRGSRTPNANS